MFSDAEIAEGGDLVRSISQEAMPDDPPTPIEIVIATSREVPPRVRRWTFRAWAPDGTLGGLVDASIDPEHDDNPDVLDCAIWVARDHRRRGVATALLAQFVALSRAERRNRLIGTTADSVPAGASFAQALGAEPKTAVHFNHLPTAEVNRSLMQQWVDQGPLRASDYELVAWDRPMPDEHVADFVDLMLVMNDAPRDELNLNDFTISVAQLREDENELAAAGCQTWTLVARRRSDAALAGFHELVWCPHDPHSVYISSTGVRAEHRGHALGKWLKAAMTLRVLNERPEVTDIRTENADSNDAMLGINQQMGYRPLIGTTKWEVTVDAIADWLMSRGLEIPGAPAV